LDYKEVLATGSDVSLEMMILFLEALKACHEIGTDDFDWIKFINELEKI
jgi:hypothetical protein